MNRLLAELRDARKSRNLPDRVVAAGSTIAEQRAAIEVLMLTGPTDGVRIYGFNTLLGQLDELEAPPGFQPRLLDAHLIGRKVGASSDYLNTMTLVKLFQLSHGGSGISGTTYQKLVAASFAAQDGFGAFWDSYGSGDVVPAAWWIVSVLGESAAYEFEAGDLIALMNGNFVSTAAAVILLDEIIDVSAHIVARAAMRMGPPSPSTDNAVQLALSALPRRDRVAGVQLPVSARDLGPIVDAVTEAIHGLGRALERRLSGPSANPLFRFDSGRARAYSQNSFLDVRLTMALSNTATGLGFALAAFQRHIELISAEQLASDPQYLEMVQPPKVAQAILQEALRSAGMPVLVSIVESAGVEDLADGSLAAAQNVGRLVERANDLLALDDLVLPVTLAPSREVVEAVGLALVEIALGSHR